MTKVREYEQCGLPVKRRDGSAPCILEAGHRATWCQDQRALEAGNTLRRVEELAQQARAVLGLFGCALGRGDTERWIADWLWSGKPAPG